MRVQSDLATIPANSTSITVSIKQVDTTKAFLRMSNNVSLDSMEYTARGIISSPTTVTFIRNAGTASSITVIAWQIID